MQIVCWGGNGHGSRWGGKWWVFSGVAAADRLLGGSPLISQPLASASPGLVHCTHCRRRHWQNINKLWRYKKAIKFSVKSNEKIGDDYCCHKAAFYDTRTHFLCTERTRLCHLSSMRCSCFPGSFVPYHTAKSIFQAVTCPLYAQPPSQP